MPDTVGNLPAWVPDKARRYLAHIEAGVSIRTSARREGCHASTVLRQIRRYEALRDDVLVDEALRRLGRLHLRDGHVTDKKDAQTMSHISQNTKMQDAKEAPDAVTLRREGLRILRRLCESGAVLAVAADMEMAVVMRDSVDGTTSKTAVVERTIAEAMALQGWIACSKTGRIARYRITPGGRSALNRMLAEAENSALGFAEAPAGYEAFGAGGAGQHAAGSARRDSSGRQLRQALAESPLAALARRKDRDGTPFLSEELVNAGERLREDFELSQVEAGTTQNWAGFLTGGVQGGAGSGAHSGQSNRAGAARARVEAALAELGPGLGDMALRCCCYLEGLEKAEQRMGWSARSGKIVLRIALIRLQAHYAREGSVLIG